MIRLMLFVVASALCCITNGCHSESAVSPGVNMEDSTLVTVNQLKEAVRGESSFFFLGSDEKYHYFETQRGFYRMSRSFKLSDVLEKHIEMKQEIGAPPGSTKLHVRFDGESIKAVSGHYMNQN